MHLSFALLALAAHLAVVLRVLTYRRNGARHRARIAWTAWLIVAVSGGAAIELLIDPRPVSLFQAAQAVLLTLFVHLAGGNVAQLMRSKGV